MSKVRSLLVVGRDRLGQHGRGRGRVGRGRPWRRRFDRFGDDGLRSDHDGHRTAERLFLADDPGGQDGEGGHVEEAEADPDPGEVVRVVAAEQATPSHRAHLVIELRPADAAAPIAEPNELDGVRIRR